MDAWARLSFPTGLAQEDEVYLHLRYPVSVPLDGGRVSAQASGHRGRGCHNHQHRESNKHKSAKDLVHVSRRQHGHHNRRHRTSGHRDPEFRRQQSHNHCAAAPQLEHRLHFPLSEPQRQHDDQDDQQKG